MGRLERQHLHADNTGHLNLIDKLSAYWPLACLVVTSGLAALALTSGFSAPAGTSAMSGFMHAYMGVFLIVFALLKLFDLNGFRSGFAKYDLLAKANPTYGLVYPFIELGLGLTYLAFIMPDLVYVITIAVFGFGAIGVIKALREGLNINCPCMGNILSVPLSTVTLTEDLGMVVMAGLLLAQ
ncbi:MAG: MauE/DoxX family redox-associated membrane protein [Hyphomicrobiaceae bacterium]